MVNWFAVYTHAGCEIKLAESLIRKGFESYCPVIRACRKPNNARKIVMEPLFTSLIYVRTQESELDKVKSMEYVLNIMYWLQQPAIIKDVEIDMLKTFLKEQENIQLEKSEVHTNDIVKLVKEPYEEEGIILENYNKIRLVLPSIGFTLTSIVREGNIEFINKKRTALLLSEDTELPMESEL